MLGTIIEDRYLVEAELGAGAMGHVYRARHVKVGRHVAIKVMHSELARVPSIVERFAREARIAARLDHPNLVSVLDVGMTAERLPLLVLELAPGVALADIIRGPMDRDQVVTLVRQVLRGLDHAHDAGLIHRDLKPDNILVEQTSDGELVPRIVDFGIAVYSRDDDPIAAQRLTEANMVIGTPCYMSPEQALAKQVDARTDLFSLGVIMYELLAGMPPFPGSGLDVAVANASLDAPTIAERAGIFVDPLLEAFVHKLMARQLDARFQSAHEALSVLDLIERDRIAAARALSSDAPALAPIPVLAVGSGPVEKVSAVALPQDVSAPTPRRSTVITRVEQVAGMRPGRRRAVWAVGIAAAALTAIVGWSAGIRPQAAARVEASLDSSDVQLEIRGAANAITPPAVPSTPAAQLRVEDEPAVPPVAIVATPGLRVQDAPRVAAKPARTVVANEVAAPAVAAAPAADAARVPHAAHAAHAPIASPAAHAGPATERASAPSAAKTPAPIDESAAAVAERYVAVGRMLRGAHGDLWTRYRMIKINDALASEASRRAALVALADIERAVRADAR